MVSSQLLHENSVQSLVSTDGMVASCHVLRGQPLKPINIFASVSTPRGRTTNQEICSMGRSRSLSSVFRYWTPKYFPTSFYIQRHASEGQSNGATGQQGINTWHLGRLLGPAKQRVTCVPLNNTGVHYKVREASSCEEFNLSQSVTEATVTF